MTLNESNSMVPRKATSDNPIAHADADVLRRDPLAERFARSALATDASEGLVVGILGPWGSGKTSVLNLMRPHLHDAGATIIDFNPWMFSGADQLVQAFFAVISHELKVKPGLKHVGEAVGAYGDLFSGLAWVPVVGAVAEGAKGIAKAFQAATAGGGDSMSWKRNRIVAALRDVEHPIVVILDDIDRLSTAEVRDVFKLVRLTASFPNVIYVVAFDRSRVESALTEGEIKGRDYLEKILQLALDLPVVGASTLQAETFEALNEATQGLSWVDEVDEHNWADRYTRVVRPLVGNMRDVRRYGLAVSATVHAFGGRLALSDLLTLEAIRTFLPDVFAMLPRCVEALTATGRRDPASSDAQKALLSELVAAGRQEGDATRQAILLLFPAASDLLGGSIYGSDWNRNWRRERRVAVEENLRFYLEHVEGESLLNARLAETALVALADESALGDLLDQLAPEQRVDVLQSLLDYREDFRLEHVVPGISYSVRALPELPRVRPEFFALSSDLIVGLLVHELLKTAADGGRLLQDVTDSLQRAPTLSARRVILHAATRRSGSDEPLLDLDDSNSLWRQWTTEVRRASPEDLSAEPDLLPVVWLAAHAEGEAIDWRPPSTPELDAKLLVSAIGTTKVTQMGSAGVQYKRYIRWDDLAELLGGERGILARLETARAVLADEEEDALALYDRYVTGWRPE